MTGGEHARSGVRGASAGMGIEHRHAGASRRGVPGGGEADDASTHYDEVERNHRAIVRGGDRADGEERWEPSRREPLPRTDARSLLTTAHEEVLVGSGGARIERRPS